MNQRDNLNKILESPEFAPNIVINRPIPAQDGIFAPFPEELDERVVVTPAASGKTR